MKKGFFIVFNIIYMAIIAACIGLTLVMPLANATATYTITPELMEKTVGPIEGVDYADIVGKDGTPVNMSIKIQTKDLILSYTGGTTEDFFRKQILEPNVESLTKEFSVKFNEVISNTIKAKLAVAVKNGIKSAVEKELEKFKEYGKDPQEIMNEAGLTDEYFANVGIKTYDEIVKTGATLTSVVNFAVGQIEEAYNMIGTKYPESGFSGKKVSSDQRAEIENELSKALSNLNMLRADGTIKPIESAIAAMLDEALNDNKGSTADSIEAVLNTYFYSVITPDTVVSITLGLKILFWIIIFMLASWLVFIIITLIRTIGKKKYTFTGVWYWITFAFTIILGLVVFIAGYAYNAFIPEIIKLNPTLEYLKYFKFSAITSLTIPCFLLIVMSISYIWYHHYKKKAIYSANSK